MSLTPITVANLSTKAVSLSLNFARDRQYNGTLAVGKSVDLSSIATIDEVSRQSSIQSLIAKGIISVTTTPLGTTDLADPGLTLSKSILVKSATPNVSAISAAVSAGTPVAVTITGANFFQSMTRAAVNAGSNTGSTCGVTATSLRPGNSGNLIAIVYITSGGGSSVASNATTQGGIAYTGNGEITAATVITLTYGTTTTAATIVTSLTNAANKSSTLVTAAALAGGTSSRTFDGGAANPGTTNQMTGGGGGAATGSAVAANNFQVLLGGLQQDVTAASNTSITILPVAGTLTGLSAANIVPVIILANGVQSAAVSMVLAT